MARNVQLGKKDVRLQIYLNALNTEDALLRDRIVVAAKTLGVSTSGLMRNAAEFALNNLAEFSKTL